MKFKIGDKVKCVETGGYHSITVGRIYEVIENDAFIGVISDHGYICRMLSRRFRLHQEKTREDIALEMFGE